MTNRGTTRPTSPSSARSTYASTERPTARSATSGTARRSCCSRPPDGAAASSRTSALIFGRDGDDYLVVASMGGAPQHPSWYLNITAQPERGDPGKGGRIPVTARTASDDEKPRLWRIVTDVWPNYDVYQTAHRPVDPGRRVVAVVSVGRRVAVPLGRPRRRSVARRCSARVPRQIEQAKVIVDAARRLIDRTRGRVHDAGAREGGRRRAADLLSVVRRQGPTPARGLRGHDRRALASQVERSGPRAAGSGRPTALLRHRRAAGRRRRRRAASASLRHRRALAALPTLSRRDVATRHSRSPISCATPADAAAADGSLAPPTTSAMHGSSPSWSWSVFHHYAFADGDAGHGRRSANELWSFCLAALGGALSASAHRLRHHRVMTATTVEVPDSLDELLTPAWLTARAVVAVPGHEGHGGDARARRRAACRPTPGSTSSATPSPAGTVARAVRQGVLLGAGPFQQAGR